jgi:hypothetical protein
MWYSSFSDSKIRDGGIELATSNDEYEAFYWTGNSAVVITELNEQ